MHGRIGMVWRTIIFSGDTYANMFFFSLMSITLLPLALHAYTFSSFTITKMFGSIVVSTCDKNTMSQQLVASTSRTNLYRSFSADFETTENCSPNKILFFQSTHVSTFAARL